MTDGWTYAHWMDRRDGRNSYLDSVSQCAQSDLTPQISNLTETLIFSSGRVVGTTPYAQFCPIVFTFFSYTVKENECYTFGHFRCKMAFF